MIKFSSYHRSKRDAAPNRRQENRQVSNPDLTAPRNSYFKRGQTIAQRALDVSERSSVRDLTLHRQFLIKAITTLIVAIGILTVIIWQSIFSVEIRLLGFDRPPENKIINYQQTFNEYFKKFPLERFSLSLDINRLNDFLAQQQPELSEVIEIELRFLRPTIVRLKARQPLAMWTINGVKYYVDDQGRAFSHNFFTDPELEVIDQSGLDPKQSPRIVSNDFLGFIGQTVGLAADKGLVAKKIIIPALTTRQIEVFFENYDFPIKFVTSGSAPRQVEDAYRSVKYLKQNNIKPIYLDVRVNQKAYYK